MDFIKWGFKEYKPVQYNWFEKLIIRIVGFTKLEERKCINVYHTNLSIGQKKAIENKEDNYYLINFNQLVVEYNGKSYIKIIFYNRKEN